MTENLHHILSGTFYIHEGYAAACLAGVYKNFVSVSYRQRVKEEMIAERIETTLPQGTTDTRSVAVITFNQPVVKYDYFDWLGTQTYIKILDRFKADASVAGVVVKMDSGGGQVYGTPEYYDYVLEFKKEKPIVTYAGGYLCSGAYYMSAPTSWIVVNKRADKIGSIGAYGTVPDLNGIIEHFGGKVHTIYATESTEKNDAYRDVLNGDYKKYISNELDPIVASFKDDMIAVRPQLKPEVFKGGTWPGNEAVAMGLADEEGTEETAIAKVYELAQGYSNNSTSKSKKSMSKTKSLPHVQKALGIQGDLKISKKLSGATGFFVSEAQLDALEAQYAAQEQAVTTADGKTTTAQSAVTALNGAVNAAIKTAGLEADVEAGASAADKVSLLGSKVVEYGKQPGAKPSTPKSDGDPVVEESDDQETSTSLYKSFI